MTSRQIGYLKIVLFHFRFSYSAAAWHETAAVLLVQSPSPPTLSTQVTPTPVTGLVRGRLGRDALHSPLDCPDLKRASLSVATR